jgi:hypothetical protein
MCTVCSVTGVSGTFRSSGGVLALQISTAWGLRQPHPPPLPLPLPHTLPLTPRSLPPAPHGPCSTGLLAWGAGVDQAFDGRVRFPCGVCDSRPASSDSDHEGPSAGGRRGARAGRGRGGGTCTHTCTVAQTHTHKETLAFLYIHACTHKRRPEPVAQSVASLTADQKVWGSMPTRAKAKLGDFLCPF